MQDTEGLLKVYVSQQLDEWLEQDTDDGGSSDEENNSDRESDGELVVAPCRCSRNNPTQRVLQFIFVLDAVACY